MLAIVRPDDRRDLRLRLVVPRLQHARDLSAGLGLFRPHRARRLGDPGCSTSILLGGVAWIGSHDLDPAKPLASAHGSRSRSRCVSLDWKWLFIYPDQGVASVNQLVVPAGVPLHFCADLGERDERVLRPAARQHDLHDERHDDAAEPAGRSGRAPSTACRRISAATASPDMHFDVRRGAAGAISPPGSTTTRKHRPDAR